MTKALQLFIKRWRDEHKEGWHEAECCVNDLLDELEALEDAAPEVRNPRGASVACSIAGCVKQASFIIHGTAFCEEHRP